MSDSEELSENPLVDAPAADRLAALEGDVAALRHEVGALRALAERSAGAGTPPLAGPARPAESERAAWSPDAGIANALRRPPRAPAPSLADRVGAAPSLSGDEIESMVGRYGTLVLAAAVILSAVGAVIKMAVERGLITPEVRVFAGLLVAVAVGGAGLYFRRRGDTRYGGVLLALALAIVDLVAWAAGPLFHLVPTAAAMALVDVVALVLVTIALRDESEFLFAVAVAGALSAPFVTADESGQALTLLVYGGGVLAGALRSAREPAWRGAFLVLVVGAFVYALSAASLPIGESWYGPYLIALFGGACAALALLFGEPEWRGSLPRAYLAVAGVGAVVGWDRVANEPLRVALPVSLVLAAVTYVALLRRDGETPFWRTSAVLLPLVSLAVASAATHGALAEGAMLALWTAFALAAWRVERATGAAERGSAHLLAAGLLGGSAVTAALWDHPLGFVAGLAAWGVTLAALARHEESALPLAGVAAVLGAAVLSSMDQLVSRSTYAYVPFVTRSSASALCAAVGIGVTGLAIARGTGVAKQWADRGTRLGLLIGFVIVWGRMEVAQAFSADLSAFLLSSYYAACGVGSIVAGRRLGLRRLRIAGLGLALYAAFKALVEVTEIQSLPLRVGAYAAVGVFLLGAGWLYRERN